MRKNIFVTGGAGFIGSNFIPYFMDKYPDYTIINIDSLTYAGELSNLKEVANNPEYIFEKTDITDRKAIDGLFNKYKPLGVIHFAAESHVDNSINNPDAFIKTNVNGTFNLLDAARKLWMDSPFVYKKEFENARFHHISTDEVYGSLGETGYFTEKTPYAPNSPYSASKASSDMIARAYHHTFGLNLVITNCSNNYGPKQHEEKLIPTIIRKALTGEAIPIYGNGKNIRDWLYVLDHCRGIDLAFHKGRSGENYNIGGHNEKQNIDIANTICEILDKKRPSKNGKSYKEQISYVTDRAGHDLRYAIDPAKLETELGFRPQENFDSGILLTVDWYLKNKYQ